MQRVVAGTLGGRRLLPLPRSIQGVRPSSSRVRSAIFDRLQAEVVGARVLDLFAGSGGLAIEALSRGAAHATLVELQPPLARFLDQQLAALGLGDRATVVCDDARRFVSGDRGVKKTILTRSAARGFAPWDLVLVDPPYAEIGLYGAVLAGLAEGGALAADAIIVIEYEKHRGQRPAIAVPPSFVSEAVRDHGQTALEFLRVSPLPPRDS